MHGGSAVEVVVVKKVLVDVTAVVVEVTAVVVVAVVVVVGASVVDVVVVGRGGPHHEQIADATKSQF